MFVGDCAHKGVYVKELMDLSPYLQCAYRVFQKEAAKVSLKEALKYVPLRSYYSIVYHGMPLGESVLLPALNLIQLSLGDRVKLFVFRLLLSYVTSPVLLASSELTPKIYRQMISSMPNQDDALVEVSNSIMRSVNINNQNLPASHFYIFSAGAFYMITSYYLLKKQRTPFLIFLFYFSVGIALYGIISTLFTQKLNFSEEVARANLLSCRNITCYK
jgi:hypothetical protein